jgi:hypothetical protein
LQEELIGWVKAVGNQSLLTTDNILPQNGLISQTKDRMEA